MEDLPITDAEGATPLQIYIIVRELLKEQKRMNEDAMREQALILQRISALEKGVGFWVDVSKSSKVIAAFVIALGALALAIASILSLFHLLWGK